MSCKGNIYHKASCLFYHEMSHNVCYFTVPTPLRFHKIQNSKTPKVLSIKLILAILLIMLLLITVINSSFTKSWSCHRIEHFLSKLSGFNTLHGVK